MNSTPLQQAISVIKSGDKATGRNLLSKIVQEEPENEAAWLWLATCLESNEEKISCLNHALAINPGNQHAQQALVQLQKLVELPHVKDIVQATVTPSLAEHQHEQPLDQQSIEAKLAEQYASARLQSASSLGNAGVFPTKIAKPSAWRSIAGLVIGYVVAEALAVLLPYVLRYMYGSRMIDLKTAVDLALFAVLPGAYFVGGLFAGMIAKGRGTMIGFGIGILGATVVTWREVSIGNQLVTETWIVLGLIVVCATIGGRIRSR